MSRISVFSVPRLCSLVESSACLALILKCGKTPWGWQRQFSYGGTMLAVSISVPRAESTINAAVADHVPVAELIPHLVQQEAELKPGEHWVLSRSISAIRPEHSLSEAGVRPGELLTLDIAMVPQPEAEAVDQLTGKIGSNHAAWFAACIAALFSLQSAPLFHPLAHHGRHQLGLAAGASAMDYQALLLLAVTGIAALCAAAGSLFDRRYTYIAALLGFGLGLHINVLCACACAALMVWRPGPARVFTLVVTVFAAINFFPGLTLVLALLTLTFSGQIAIGIAQIKLPRVPATGLFQEPVHASSGNVITIHSTVVIALCSVIFASIYQLIPWGSRPSVWIIALAVCTAMIGLSSRGARPVHATAVVVLSAVILVWLAIHVSFGALVFALLVLPAIHVRSPLAGRIIDGLESLSFACAIPLALHSTGIFELIRGIG